VNNPIVHGTQTSGPHPATGTKHRPEGTNIMSNATATTTTTEAKAKAKARATIPASVTKAPRKPEDWVDASHMLASGRALTLDSSAADIKAVLAEGVDRAASLDAGRITWQVSTNVTLGALVLARHAVHVAKADIYDGAEGDGPKVESPKAKSVPVPSTRSIVEWSSALPWIGSFGLSDRSVENSVNLVKSLASVGVGVDVSSDSGASALLALVSDYVTICLADDKADVRASAPDMFRSGLNADMFRQWVTKRAAGLVGSDGQVFAPTSKVSEALGKVKSGKKVAPVTVADASKAKAATVKAEAEASAVATETLATKRYKAIVKSGTVAGINIDDLDGMGSADLADLVFFCQNMSLRTKAGTLKKKK
jgi:hypothetical protein